MSEGFPSPATATAEVAIPEVVYDETYFRENYGLGLKDAEQYVAYEGYSGTLGQMLTDPRCPVGGTIRRAYQEGIQAAGPEASTEARTEAGREAVQRKFRAIGELDSNFVVNISPEPIVDDKKKYDPENGKP